MGKVWASSLDSSRGARGLGGAIWGGPVAVWLRAVVAVDRFIACASSWLRGLALVVAHRKVRAAALVRDSLEAVADTTQRLFLGDLAVADRRAIQVEAERDSLDRQLPRETSPGRTAR